MDKEDLPYIWTVANESQHNLVKAKLVELITAVKLVHGDEVAALRRALEEEFIDLEMDINFTLDDGMDFV